VVGRLLDLETPLGVACDDDDPVDGEVTSVLDRAEGLVGLPGHVGVAEVGDEERRGSVADGGHVGGGVGHRGFPSVGGQSSADPVVLPVGSTG
jgi:hypothetical protein